MNIAVATGGNSPKPYVIEQLHKAGESIVKTLKGTTFQAKEMITQKLI